MDRRFYTLGYGDKVNVHVIYFQVSCLTPSELHIDDGTVHMYAVLSISL